jgi:hypothetical protein
MFFNVIVKHRLGMYSDVRYTVDSIEPGRGTEMVLRCRPRPVIVDLDFYDLVVTLG